MTQKNVGTEIAENASGRRFKEIQSDFYKFQKEGDSVEGTLTRLSSQTFSRRGQEPTEVGRYKLTDDAGHDKTILGSTQLDDKLETVPDGAYVRITFVGRIPTGQGQSLKSFKVEVAY